MAGSLGQAPACASWKAGLLPVTPLTLTMRAWTLAAQPAPLNNPNTPFVPVRPAQCDSVEGLAADLLAEPPPRLSALPPALAATVAESGCASQ